MLEVLCCLCLKEINCPKTSITVYHLTWHHIPEYLILQNFYVVVVVVVVVIIIIIYQLSLLNKLFFYVLSDYECGRYLYFVVLIVVEWDMH